jgi:hypothetical protein
MRTFRGQSPHREAMAKLPHWCDEASVAYWRHESQAWPSWEYATDQLVTHGRLSHVSHPSQEQAQGRIVVT